MVDHQSLADIAAHVKALKEQAQSVTVGSAPETVRFVVATDWSDASVPLTVLRAYRAAFAAEAAVELCFAVPHEPGDVDAECVQVLIEGLGDDATLPSISVESFDEVLRGSYDAAVVPHGDSRELLFETGGVITRMFDISRQLREDAVTEANPGSASALRRRLEAFAA